MSAQFSEARFSPLGYRYSTLGSRTAGVAFGVTEDSMARLRDLEGRFIRFDADAAVATNEQLRAIALLMKERLRSEFIAAGHDRGPLDLQADPGRTVRSIDTIEVQIGPMWAKVSMGGGAAYVETGTPPHIISIRGFGPDFGAVTGSEFPAQLGQQSMLNQGATRLHWKGPADADHPGGDYYATSVKHPGYKGDKFVERAMASGDVDLYLARIATMTFTEVLGTASSFTRVLGRP